MFTSVCHAPSSGACSLDDLVCALKMSQETFGGVRYWCTNEVDISGCFFGGGFSYKYIYIYRDMCLCVKIGCIINCAVFDMCLNAALMEALQFGIKNWNNSAPALTRTVIACDSLCCSLHSLVGICWNLGSRQCGYASYASSAAIAACLAPLFRRC